MVDVSTLHLNNGLRIPQLGFGVFLIPPDETERAVRQALDAGYRLIDTAAAYGNEEGVGRALADSGLARDDVFVTTKLWNADQGYDNALRAFDGSLHRLGLDTVDLYLIHWPTPGRDRYVETWRVLQNVYRDGRARAIGVSNFTVRQLRRLLAETEVVPAVNQVELHPRFSQAELRQFHAAHGVVTEAWGPLGQGRGLLDDPTVGEVARAVDRTPAQVVLRWHVQLGNVAVPKSVTPQRIRQNIEVFDFTLDDGQLAAISGLDSPDGRLGPDPDRFDAA